MNVGINGSCNGFKTAVLCIGDLKKHTFLSQLFLQSASRVVW